MKLPDRITIKLVSEKKEIKLNDISLWLILFKSYRNNHHLILPNSDIDGVVTINKEMMLNEVHLDRSLFLMDYDYHNEFEPEIEISVMTEKNIVGAYRGGIDFNLITKYPEKYKMLENAENYKVKPKSMRINIENNNNPTIEFPIKLCSKKLILEHRKQYDIERIFILAGYGNQEEFLTLLNHNNINSKNRFGLSLLHSAILGNNKEVIDILLDYNININIIDYDGSTALHYLAQFPTDLDIVKKIIDNGGDLCIRDFHGNSAYDIAKIYQKENKDLLKLLSV